MAIVVMPSIFPESARHLYFEASAMIIGLINLGQALELKARGRTSQAIRRLLDLRAKTALVIRDGETVKLPIEQVIAGDKVVIRAGERCRSMVRLLTAVPDRRVYVDWRAYSGC
ncbi:hypothetical protein JCM19236_532 [Vibrio sp. JCM 19236]|nr:hypothetical protein JCM19236_532 [Vibrio sp. JCM 19236]